jgi:hypothetical protein
MPRAMFFCCSCFSVGPCNDSRLVQHMEVWVQYLQSRRNETVGVPAVAA